MNRISREIKYFFIFLGIKNCSLCGETTRSVKFPNKKREYSCAKSLCKNNYNWLSKRDWNKENSIKF